MLLEGNRSRLFSEATASCRYCRHPITMPGVDIRNRMPFPVVFSSGDFSWLNVITQNI